MNPNAVRKPEQIRLIMECRQSGLSDYQWCQQQVIKPSTFYNWVSKLQKTGYTIPDSESKFSGLPIRQEVVKLDLAESENSSPVIVEQKVSHQLLSGVSCITAEIECGNIKVRLFNGADASMMVYSFLETARANGLNPQRYLEYLLEARPNKNLSDGELENMAPWNPKVQKCCANQS